jgi:hypothetical protein
MNRRALEYLARRMEQDDRGRRNMDGDTEMRRRRRSDGTFMRGTGESQMEIEYTPQGERNTDNRRRTEMHKGPDDESRRRIGFGQGKGESKSHWSEEEFVGDMEESLYHEVDDIFHYAEIMEKVYKKGYDDLACAFYEIANEKYICAEFLRHQLKKTGHYSPSEHEELEEDLKEAKKMFKEA